MNEVKVRESFSRSVLFNVSVTFKHGMWHLIRKVLIST